MKTVFGSIAAPDALQTFCLLREFCPANPQCRSSRLCGTSCLSNPREAAHSCVHLQGGDSRPVRAQRAKLSQLQRLARFGQSARAGVRSRLWPTFQHFGQQHLWGPLPGEDPPVSALALPWATVQTLRSALSLAPHRMPAYRLHAHALAAAAGKLQCMGSMPEAQP